MEIEMMTSKQLIEKVHVLEQQILDLKENELKHKKVEEALYSSDEKFRLLFSTAPIGLIITNQKGDVININNVIEELLGYNLATCKEMNVVDFYVDHKERERLLEILSVSKHVYNFEAKLKHQNGSIKTMLMNSDYIELDGEKVLLTSMQDITQIKHVQEDLTASEKEYHLLFSNAPVGITVTDFAGKLTASNQAIQELLGYNAEELKNKSVCDFYYNVEERKKLLALTEKTGIVRDFEVKFRHKNGSPLTVLINTDLIDFKNQHKVLLTSIRDITNLKQVEEELTKERDFTNAILNTAALLMVVTDRNGVITRFNKASEKSADRSSQEIKERHMEEILNGNFPSQHEDYWYSKSGEQRLISWTDAALLDQNGEVEYIVATGIDITEQRIAETELKEVNQKLAKWIDKLEEKTTEMNMMSEMGEQLQNCQNIQEAGAISAQYIQRLCPDSHGALYLINSSKNLSEAIEMWGAPSYTEKTFLPLNCWAVRRNGVHLVDEKHLGLPCEHITGAKGGQYICLPLMAQGEVVGIIHLNYEAVSIEQQESVDLKFDKHKVQVMTEFAEHIALALSNLKLRDALRQQSIRDVLTGLFNRRYMEETLMRELKRAEREQKSVGVIMFDIDHFKQFNDLSGHDGGDALLRELGSFLNKSVRGGDIVCRYGGEEFVVVLPEATLEITRIRAEELRKGAKELLVYHLGKALGRCTISLGVSAYPENGMTNDQLLKSADNALYKAKNEGRDKVVVAV